MLFFSFDVADFSYTYREILSKVLKMYNLNSSVLFVYLNFMQTHD